VELEHTRRWLALALVCAAQFMVVLDVAIVNVALPSIQTDLHFSQENLQWIVSGYAITFGGFLLLGGRAADLLGRREVFMAGLVLFTLASLACGLAWSDSSLIAARAVQGLGAAIVSPATLSIVSDLFEEGPDRNRAIGIWGAIGAVGAAAGVLLGGILTTGLGWEWIFFVNVPVGAIALALSPVLLPRGRRTVRHRRDFDFPGAVVVTGSLVLLVYTIVKANDVGWASGRTIGGFIVSAFLLGLFALWELRAKAPLMPLGFFRNRTPTGANVVSLLMGGSLFAMFFLLSLYMQEVLGYSALKAGVAYLTIALTTIFTAGIASQLVTRIGVKPILAAGMAIATVGLLLFTRVSVGGDYVHDLLPGFVVTAFGLGFSFVPVSIAALQGVKLSDAGLASGLINTGQQIGGALGVAIITAVATARTDQVLSAGGSRPTALTDGFQRGFLVGAFFAAAGVLVTLFVIRRERPRELAAAVEEQIAQATTR
jgi:EmrB/QacA subfamily drug resistance transporter